MSLFLLLLLLLVSSSVKADFNGFVDCRLPPLKCSDRTFNLNYPFRLPTSLNRCGFPGFELYCTDNTPFMYIGPTNSRYIINDINYTTQEIHITDANFANTTSCPHNSLTNLSFNTFLFEYSEQDVNITVYLNCPQTLSVNMLNLYNFACGVTNTMNQSFYTVQNDVLSTAQAEALRGCGEVVNVPVNRTEVEELARNGMSGLLGVLKDGFGLRWKVGDEWCKECVGSSGICGYNPSSPEEHVCYCSDSTSRDGACVANGDTKQSSKFSDSFSYFLNS